MRDTLQEGSSRSAGSRKPNADGTVTVVCRRCGDPIIRMISRGFSTAICLKCQGIEVPEPEVEQFEGVYGNDPAKEKVGKVQSLFRALGFRKKKPPKPPQEKSREMAKEKQRKPLFGPEDEKDE
jgi:hypothetical protein